MIRRLISLLCVLTLMACSGGPDRTPGAPPRQDDVAALTQQIMALGPNVSAEEATRAARITYGYTAQLVEEYQITDAPLVHNAKVNRGTKPRGLCWHWAEDIENRLKQENFQTLSLHRAIANYKSPILIEHSTTIISARGDGMYDGVVVDPWRYGGVLFWALVREDMRYDWTPRQEVFEWKRARGILKTRYVTAG